jgi:hypothetical protein
MRLGKEQAAGYVEDTEDDALPTEELTTAQSDGIPLTTATEPALTVS